MMKQVLALLILSAAAFAQGGIFNDIALSSTGRPAPGASVRVCSETATGTPCSPTAVLYTSSALTTVSSTNPVTADSSGNFHFYAPIGIYKLQITSGGSTYTYSAAVSGMGAVNVRYYGARADGGTDDTAAIQAAHSAAVAAGYGIVYFPAGTYKVSSALGWSPYVQAVSLGAVLLQTPLASGNFISISDEYGKRSPDPNSTGLTRSKTFTGEFYIQNTNTSNTARALFIGGATVANYASQMAIDGMNITGFKGGVVQFGYNAFLLNFSNFFAINNVTGAQISILSGATNMGEGISFDKCTFGGGGGTPAGMLLSINSALPIDFKFSHCSFDYLAGINDAAQTAALADVSFTNSHFEWDQATAPYIDLNNGISVNLVNPYFTSSLVAGWNNPFVGRVTGAASSLKVTNAHYTFAPGIARLYQGTASTSRIDLDPHPNYQGGSAPTTYVTYNADNNPRVSILDSGLVGIAKAVPVQALDVTGSIAASADVITDSIKSKSSDLIIDSAVAGRAIILKINSTEKARLDTTGFFGVNNAAPSVALDVTGQIKASGAVTIGGGTPILKYVEGTVTVDLASIPANTCTDTAGITATGAVDGDVVVGSALAAIASTAGLTISAYVSAADTAKVRICNVTIGAIDPPSTTYRVGVWVH